MKKLFRTDNRSNTFNIALLVGRIGIAVLMLVHGLPKLSMLLSGDPIQFPPIMGMSPELSLSLAVFAEVICSIFILLGFATRLAAIPLVITMLVAVLLVHAADPFSVKELAVHYLLSYVVLFIAGSGRYSLDNLLQKRTAYLGRKEKDASLAI